MGRLGYFAVLTLFVCTASVALGASKSDSEKGAFFDLPPVQEKLDTASRRTIYLKANIALELEDPGMRERVETVLPRVLDTIQVYLRGTRVEDFSTSRNLDRLRTQLREKINAEVGPARVSDVLFKKIALDE